MSQQAPRPYHEPANMPLPPKSSSNLTDRDWERVLKESRWNSSYNVAVFMKYFGVRSVDAIQYDEHVVDEAYSVVPRYCLEAFIKSEGFTIDRLAWITEDSDYSVEWNMIDTGSDEKVNRVLNGQFFISKDNHKYIFESKMGYHDNYIFKVVSLRDNDPNGKELLEKFLKYTEKHNFLRGKKIDPNCNFIKLERRYTWDDIVLSEKLKTEIRQNISNLIKHQGLYRDNKLNIRRGIVFSGPPGVGKTNLIKILCATIDWTLIWISPKHLENSRKVAAIMQLAKDLSPSVIVLEDIDLYGASREINSNPTVLGELMNQLDGVEGLVDIITIATTNRPEVMEKALLDRPGRFDKVIEFELPEKAERQKMLELFSSTIKKDDSFTWEELAGKPTETMSGAQIREIISQGVIQAVDDNSVEDGKIILQYKHLKKAMRAIKGKDFSRIGIQVPTSASSFVGSEFSEDRW